MVATSLIEYEECLVRLQPYIKSRTKPANDRPLRFILRYTFEGCVISLIMAKAIIQLVRKSGLLFTALYLKQCSAYLCRFYGMDSNITISGPKVKLNRKGLPVIIPFHHRHIIMSRNERADYLVKLYLSWFSINRLVKLSKPINSKTLKSIMD